MRYLRLLLPIALVFSCFSCATIVGSSTYTVHIESNPSNAHVSVINKKGKEVYAGATPADVSLSSKAGYFSPAAYEVRVKLSGYQDGLYLVDAKMSPWYFGNIVFGGLIGMLIVDPLTGAMWRIKPDQIIVNLDPAGAVQ